MKKLYTTSLLLLATTTLFAKVINIQTTMNAPTASQSVVVGTPFNFQVVFKNLGPDAIAPTDSLLFTFSGASGVYYKTGLTKAVNDTIYLNTQLTFSTATNGNYNFCVVGYEYNGSTITDNDTTNNKACKTIAISGGTATGVTELVMGEKAVSENLSLYPNPATGVIGFNYVAKNESELTAHVYDMSGREVMTYNYGKAYTGKTGFHLDVASLNSGIYMVEFRQDGVRSIGRLNKL